MVNASFELSLLVGDTAMGSCGHLPSAGRRWAEFCRHSGLAVSWGLIFTLPFLAVFFNLK